MEMSMNKIDKLSVICRGKNGGSKIHPKFLQQQQRSKSMVSVWG